MGDITQSSLALAQLLYIGLLTPHPPNLAQATKGHP